MPVAPFVREDWQLQVSGPLRDRQHFEADTHHVKTLYRLVNETTGQTVGYLVTCNPCSATEGGAFISEIIANRPEAVTVFGAHSVS